MLKSLPHTLQSSKPELWPRSLPEMGHVYSTKYSTLPHGISVFITYLPRSLYIFLWRVAWDISPYYTPYITRYTLSMRIVITTVIEMVEMVETLDGRLDNLSVERVRYVINNLLHLVIVKYGDISLVLCISTRLRLVTIPSLLVRYLVILHADPCNNFL